MTNLQPPVRTPEAARALAGCRRRSRRACEGCFRLYLAFPGQSYCSPACRQKAYRDRKRVMRARDEAHPAL